jgi:DNA polymerase elongation subunit (family B)
MVQTQEGTMTKFYTHITQNRNQLLVRGYENGKRFQRRVDYKPYLYVDDRKGTNSGWQSLYKKKPLARLDFGSINEARDFMKKYEDVSGFEFHGYTKWQYVYLADEYAGFVDFDLGNINKGFLDIEVRSNNGFPNISKAQDEITAITLSDGKIYYTFVTKDFVSDKEDVVVIRCQTEKELLFRFLEKWRELDLDAITGWNVESFDLPYTYNRMCNVIGQEVANQLSPWNIVNRRTFFDKMGRECEAVTIEGIATLDYMQLYLKFTYHKQEQYSLGYIGKVELGIDKVDYKAEGYTNLEDLYTRNPQLYFEYNVHDVRIVVKLDEKMDFISQALAIAYDAHVNYEDAVTSVLLWEVIILNHFNEKKIAMPMRTRSSKGSAIAGAYVKDPRPGLYGWLASFDLASLYPHLMMMFNISPEMFIERDFRCNPAEWLNPMRADFWHEMAVKEGVAIAGSGSKFRKDEQGFLPFLMQHYYDGRKKNKKMMLQYQQKLIDDPGNKEFERKVVQYNNIQMAMKIILNSAYGATSNQWFLFYNDDLAEAVTLSGQVVIQWAQNSFNAFLNKLLGTSGKDYIIAADTDSNYLNLELLVEMYRKKKPDASTIDIVQFLDKFCEEKVQPEINRFFQELADLMNAYEQKMYMKREAIAERAVWTGGKRYIMLVWNNEGVQYQKAKFKMTGIEAVRSSTPTNCRPAIAEAAELMLRTLDSEQFLKYIEKFKSEFDVAPFPDIARNSSVKDLQKYFGVDKGVPSHVAGSLAYNKLIQKHGLENIYPLIRDGDKVKFLQLKQPNPTFGKWIAFPNGELPKEFGLERYVDRQEHYQIGFLQPMTTLATAAGMPVERSFSLSDFF